MTRSQKISKTFKWLPVLLLFAAIASFPTGWGASLAKYFIANHTPLKDFRELGFEIKYISPFKLVLENIKLGDERDSPMIYRLWARYNPRKLQKGYITEVTIQHPNATLALGDGRLEVVGIGDLIDRLDALENANGSESTQWRVGKAVINDIMISATDLQTSGSLPLFSGDLELRLKKKDIYKAQWSGQLAGVSANCDAVINIEDLGVELSFKIPKANLIALAPLASFLGADVNIPTLGNMAISGTLQTTDDKILLDGLVDIPFVVGGSVENTQVSFNLDLSPQSQNIQLKTTPVSISIPLEQDEINLIDGGISLATTIYRSDNGLNIAGDLEASLGYLHHDIITMSNTWLRLPFELELDEGGSLTQIEALRPSIGWDAAYILGKQLFIEPIEAATNRAANIAELSLMNQWHLWAPGLLQTDIIADIGFSPIAEANDSKLTWHAILDVLNAEVTLADPMPIHVEGIGTKITVRPQLTGGWGIEPARLMFTNMVVNEIAIDGGVIDWRFMPGEILLERGELQWCGGVLRLYSARLSQTQTDVDLILYAEQIEAGKVLQLIKPLQGEATGRLYGRLPVNIENNKIKLSEGFLYALPGEIGSLRLEKNDFLQNYLARTGLPSGVRNNILDSLADLEYDLLRFDLEARNPNSAKLTMKLAGKSAVSKDLAPVNLDLRVNGPLEALLNLGLHLK